MSTSIASPVARGRSAQTGVLLTAGLQEAWRLIRHPAHLAGWAIAVLLLSQDDRLESSAYSYFDVGLDIVSLPATFTFAAASLIATRSRRSRTKELLTALP